MKRLLFILTAGAAALLGAVSCQVAETDRAGISQKQITITASLEDDGIIAIDGEESVPETKTMRLSNGSVWWTPGDQICLFYGSGDKGGSKFTATAEEPVASTQFRGTIDVITGGGDSGVENYWFWGVYPYNRNVVCDGNSVRVEIPMAQKSAEGTFALGQWPTVGHSLGMAMSFKNLGCGFKFKVTTPGIESVLFETGDPDRPIAGTVIVEMDSKGNPVISDVLGGGRTAVLVYPEEGLTFKPGVYYYATMIPGNFAGGLTMTFRTSGRSAKYECDMSVPEYPSGRGKFKVMNDKDSGLTWVSHPSAALLPSGPVFHKALEECGAPVNAKTGLIEAGTLSFESVASPVGTDVAPSGLPVCVSYDSENDAIRVQSRGGVYIADENCQGLLSGLAIEEINGMNLLDFSKTKDFSYLFRNCENIGWINLNYMNTASATTMKGMFDCCSALEMIELTDFIVSETTDLSGMFKGCNKLGFIRFGKYFEFTSSNCTGILGSCHTADFRTGCGDPDGDGFFAEIECTAEQATSLRKYAIAENDVTWYRFPALAFTTGEGATKVMFSKSNLYWDGNEFLFEGNQYDFARAWSSSHVSHLMWSMYPEETYAEEYGDNDAAVSDFFFTNESEYLPNPDFSVAGGMSGAWRVLCNAEWQYLLGRDQTYCYAAATVAGCPGLILFPDTFVLPEGIEIVGANDESTPVSSNTYDSAAWSKLEDAGSVFLPLAGRRDCSNIFDWDTSMFYWSSDAENATFAYVMEFNTVNGIFYGRPGRYQGSSVRLVTNYFRY